MTSNRWLLLAALLVAASVLGRAAVGVGAPAQDKPAATSGEPVWRDHLVLWPKSPGEPTPWRDDPRLRGRFEAGFPDDTLVIFMSRDPNEKPEGMWVRVIEYDSKTDLFLAVLINQPFHLKGVAEGDNVVFGFRSGQQNPVAVDDGRGHLTAAPPRTKEPAFLTTVLDGVQAYRQGNFGHNMPGIERCIAVLTPAVRTAPPAATVAERFVAHFVLARCSAEKYETKTAVEQFRAAIALAPDDLDAQMGLLAELSILVHPSPGKPLPEDQATWDQAFLDQLALVKAKFADDKLVVKMTSLIFDATSAQASKLSPEEAARSRKVGYGLFRWKRR